MKRVGGTQPSHLMYNSGVGALVDLPNFSVIVGGIDSWRNEDKQRPVSEDRLLSAVRLYLGEQVKELRFAPWMEERGGPLAEWARVGVPVFPFPRWMKCTACSVLSPIDSGLFELSHNPYRPDRSRYQHVNCLRSRGRPALAVPARLVTACPKGHLDEFPWVDFCHLRKKCTGSPKLKMIERGYGARSTDAEVVCTECDARMYLSYAFGPGSRGTMPYCRGRHPHLKKFDPEGCNLQLRAVLLGASNAWFPAALSVLSLPVSADPTKQSVAELWDELAKVESLEELKTATKFNKRLEIGLAGRDLSLIWAEIQRRKSEKPRVDEGAADLLAPEWQLLTNPFKAPQSRDFKLEVVPPPSSFADRIALLVRAERLREVNALIGFTRIDAPDSGVAEDVGDVERAPICRSNKPTWVPASEVRGEGIFVALAEDVVLEWVGRAVASERLEELRAGYTTWRRNRGLNPDSGWPGARFTLIHSFSHALIQELALECGYAAASIKERIYSREPDESGGPMAGVLFYTAAADSEGTLGGLVRLAESQTFGSLLQRALERAQVCSSDPLCAEHTPNSTDALHNAACHACLFLPETSCERGNRFLDRALLVKTLASAGLEFFDV